MHLEDGSLLELSLEDDGDLTLALADEDSGAVALLGISEAMWLHGALSKYINQVIAGNQDDLSLEDLEFYATVIQRDGEHLESLEEREHLHACGSAKAGA
jgi:hypothetical protein